MTQALALGVIKTSGIWRRATRFKKLYKMVTTTQFAGIGVHVYRRDADGIEISIINNEYITMMYGPKGRKFFKSFLAAQACAYKFGFRPIVEHEIL